MAIRLGKSLNEYSITLEIYLSDDIGFNVLTRSLSWPVKPVNVSTRSLSRPIKKIPIKLIWKSVVQLYLTLYQERSKVSHTVVCDD